MKKLNLSGFVGWEITPDLINDFLADANGEEIEVTLNSAGGDVFTGWEVYLAFDKYEGKKTLILGSLVASAATYMIMAFDHVIAQDISNVMIHDVTSYVEGNAEDIKKEAESNERIQKSIASKYAEALNKSVEEVQELMHAETWYTGQEIVDVGFADELKKTGKTAKDINFYKKQIMNCFNKEKRKENSMDKKAILNFLKTSTDVKIDEIAEVLNASNSLKSEDDMTKLREYENIVKDNKAKDEKIKELENKYNLLEQKQKLDEAFGVQDAEKTNLLRALAENYSKAGMSIEDMKKDPVMINLSAKKAAGEGVKIEDKKVEKKELDTEEY
jgi:ATP-dependent protease ClpP protease subunit